MTDRPLRMFEGVGVELEYAIVSADTLDVRPIADRLLDAAGAAGESEIELGTLAWSNELVLHVIEFKTSGAVPSLQGLDRTFHEHIRHANSLLAPLGARLMPTGMHPWMHPDREMRLWPHEAGDIYEAYNRIFDCRGHGWANLQCAHLNLPFCGDAEFERLHAAIRLVLPILPGIAASSPFADGGPTGLLDTRLNAYRTNSSRIPSITGRIVPEQLFTRADYEARLLKRLYDDIAPYDPPGLLRHEWLNSRGAIARFERNTVEVRLLDLQECPGADLAIIGAVTSVVRGLVEGRFGDLDGQKAFHENPLADILMEGIRLGEDVPIRNPDYLKVFGMAERSSSAGDLWRHLVETAVSQDPGYGSWELPLQTILQSGTLASRILRAAGKAPDLIRLREVYGDLCDALSSNRMFGV